MDFIQPQNRWQVSFGSLEDNVEADNADRLIDAFVEQLDLTRLGFVVNDLKKEGRPAYESGIFLKLYFYGYLNSIRFGRILARECQINLTFRSPKILVCIG